MTGKIHTTAIDVRFRDIDALGHVNNAVYLTYMEIARVEWCLKSSFVDPTSPHKIPNILARTEIDYKRPTTLKDSLVIKTWVSHIGNKSYTISYSIQDKKNDVVYALAKTVQVWYNYESQKPVDIPKKEKQKLLEYFHPSK